MSWEDIIKIDMKRYDESHFPSLSKEDEPNNFEAMFDKYGNKEVKIHMRFEEFKKIVEDAYSNEGKYTMKLKGNTVNAEVASMIMWLSMNKPLEAYKKLKKQGFELLMKGDLE